MWSNYYFSLIIFDDSFSYCVPTDMIDNGMLPALNYRQIMYPLFIKVVLTVFKSTNFIPLLHSIITFAISIVFLINLSKLITTKRFIIYAIGYSLAINSTYCIIAELSMLPDLLFFDSLIIICTLFIRLIINPENKITWLLLSIMFWISIGIKPIAIYYSLIYFGLIAFLLLKHYNKSILLCFALPYVLLLTLNLGYSKYRGGSYSISSPSQGYQAFLGIAASCIEPDKEHLPGFVNDRITPNISQDKTNFNKIISSFNVDTIRKYFIADYTRCYSLVEDMNASTEVQSIVKNPNFNYAADFILNKYESVLVSNAFAKSKTLFFKWFYYSFYTYVMKNNNFIDPIDLTNINTRNNLKIKGEIDYYNNVPLDLLPFGYYKDYYKYFQENKLATWHKYFGSYFPSNEEYQKYNQLNLIEKERYHFSSINASVNIQEYFFAKTFYSLFHFLCYSIYGLRIPFVLGFIFLLNYLLDIILLIKFKTLTNQKKLIFIFSTIALLNALFTCIAAPPIVRYSFPFQFIVYFSCVSFFAERFKKERSVLD